MAKASKSPERFNDAQRFAWLRLIRSKNVDPATFRALVNQFGGAVVAIEAVPNLSCRGGRQSVRRCTEAELDVARKAGMQLVALGEHGYPPALARSMRRRHSSISKAGSSLPTRPIVAIVGARNGSGVGQKLSL